MCILIIGNIDAYIIALCKDLVKIIHMYDFSGKHPCSFNRHERVIAQNLHSDLQRYIRDHSSCRPEAEDPDGLAHKLRASEIRLGFFYKYGYFAALVRYRSDPGYGTQNITRRHDERAQLKFFDSFGVCSGSIEYHYPFFCTFINRDIVVARSRPCYS